MVLPLVAGSLLFGVGWGLAGFCPGPAFVARGGGCGGNPPCSQSHCSLAWRSTNVVPGRWRSAASPRRSRARLIRTFIQACETDGRSVSDLQHTVHAANFSTSPQIAPGDTPKFAAASFRGVINERPDREGGAEQPRSAALAMAAAQADPHYAQLPVVATEIDESRLARFASSRRELPEPTPGFCYCGGCAARPYSLATGAS
jgi:uncharacterized protein (TIGR01244 family)